MRAVDGIESSSVSRIRLDGAEGRYEIRVRMPPECAVTVEAEVLTDDDA